MISNVFGGNVFGGTINLALSVYLKGHRHEQRKAQMQSCSNSNFAEVQFYPRQVQLRQSELEK